VSPSLIELALRHTLTKFAVMPASSCSIFKFKLPIVSMVSDCLLLLLLSSKEEDSPMQDSAITLVKIDSFSFST